MKTILSIASVLTTAALLHAAPPSQDKPMKKAQPAPPPPPPQVLAPGQAAPSQAFTYDQKPITSAPVLVTPEQAKAVIEKFKDGYKKLGEPRILIYVNRELVDDKTGTRLTGRTERTVASRGELKGDFQADANAAKEAKAGDTITVNAGGNVTVRTGSGATPGKGNVTYSTERVANENKYAVRERTEPALADKQTVRDVERLFGRPLRHGGAKLADQRVATQLIADKPLENFTRPTEGEQARKDREALLKVADVVLEVLISSRQIIVPEVSGDRAYQAPDIQATAIRLSDSKIMGQASASDILGKDRYAGRLLRNYDVRDIAEATALALMEDMMLGMQ
ncbi:MAG: hypothetical protein AB1705_20965 [Verrucomicrobiota bacterium]